MENIYDICDQDQGGERLVTQSFVILLSLSIVREESHIYEDLSECVDHFQMNFNIVYEENEHDYY